MVRDKTGGLFRLSVRLMQSCSEDKRDLIPVVNTLADMFQILDDYLNLQDSLYHKNKSFCEDITEGKFSFPIIHAIQKDLNDKRLIRILKQNTKDNDLKRYAVEIMNNLGSFEYTRKIILEKRDELLDMVSKIGKNDYVVSIIQNMALYIEKDLNNGTLG